MTTWLLVSCHVTVAKLDTPAVNRNPLSLTALRMTVVERRARVSAAMCSHNVVDIMESLRRQQPAIGSRAHHRDDDDSPLCRVMSDERWPSPVHLAPPATPAFIYCTRRSPIPLQLARCMIRFSASFVLAISPNNFSAVNYTDRQADFSRKSQFLSFLSMH